MFFFFFLRLSFWILMRLQVILNLNMRLHIKITTAGL